MNQIKESFEYQCGNEHKIFPIDYTREELAECLDYQPSTSEITKKILEHPFFTDVLSQLRFRPGQGQKSGTIPIPLEVVPLLKCFYDIAAGEEYQDEILKNRALTNSPASKEIRDSFARDVCLTLCKEISPITGQPDENAYYRHVVFRNAAFKRILMDDLLKKELEPRIDTIQELVKSLDTNIQITALQNCLLILDRTILDLKQILAVAERKDDPVPYEEIPSQLLEQLLEGRKQSPKVIGVKENRYAKYVVRNIRLDDGRYMKDVFDSSKLNKATLDQARKAYLSDLASQIDVGKFEEEYFKLQSYLSLVSFSGSLEERESFILEQCKRPCMILIQFCIYEPSAFLSSNWQQAYDTTLIDQLVQFYTSRSLMNFDSTLQILCFHSAQYHSLQESYKHAPNPFNAEPILTTTSNSHTHVTRFSCYLQDCWHSLNKTEAPIYDTSTCRFPNPSTFADRLWQEGQVSQQFFGCELPVLSRDEIKQELTFLNEVLGNPNYDYLPIRISRAIYKLLMLVFLQQLRVFALKATEWMIGYTDPIHDLLTDYHPSKSNN